VRLLLVRHAQTPANVRGALATTRPGPRLTRLGIRQSKAIPAALAHERIDGIYVSPLIRTSLTAAPLAGTLEYDPAVLEGIQEIEAGALEGRTDQASVKAYLGMVFSWAAGDLEQSLPGGPTGTEFFARFDEAVARIAGAHPPDSTVVAVSHGAAIRMWATVRGQNVPNDFAKDHLLDNTGVVAMTGSPEAGWIIETWAGEPVGGGALHDAAASDPTGEATA
jgi:broad specificity phosphatase PhoE